MLAYERHQEIISLLEKEKKLSVNQLIDSLEHSPSTIRRDLVLLDNQKKIVRVHGGVFHPDYVDEEPSMAVKSESYLAEKKRIAQAAAELLKENQSIYLDAGSTCVELAKLILSRRDLTIYTNSLAVPTCHPNIQANVQVLGGQLRPVSQALVGGLTHQWLDTLRFDWVFLSCSGLDITEGASTTEMTEAEVKQKAQERGKQTVLLTDSSKCQTPATVRFAHWENIDQWITDSALPSPWKKQVTKNKVILTTV